MTTITQQQPASGHPFLRRNNRGCKSEEFYKWPEQPFEDMDSPLAVQQYIQQVIRRDPADIDEILKLPEGQDLGAWKIEHLRLFCMQLNRLASKLQDCCHPETCNQMTATEQWIFLCAAHKQPNECPAIDYTRHTLDGAASLLNSNKYFPSRVTIKESSVAKLGSVCRRVYRIFSHAYYHHFQVFEEFEGETHLCKRFSKFVTIYELMSQDSLIVPSDGSKPVAEPTKSGQVTTTNEMSSPEIASSAKSDISEDMSQKQDTEDKSSSDKNTSKASKSKLESTVREPFNGESGPVLTSTAWSASTNTMVKGPTTTVSSSARADSNEVPAKSQDGTTTDDSSDVATTIPPHDNPTLRKGGESEA